MFIFIVVEDRQQRTGDLIDYSDKNQNFARLQGDNLSDVVSLVGANSEADLKWNPVSKRITYERPDPPRAEGDAPGFLVYEIEVKEIPSIITNVFGLEVEV